jgi:hypothetical protein
MVTEIFWFILSPFHMYKKDTNEVQQKIEQNQATIDEFRALTHLYFDILEAVFYEAIDIKHFIIPDYWLSLSYSSLIRKLRTYQELEILKKLPSFKFDDYSNLEINAEGMIVEYPKKRQKIQEYMAQIEKLFLEVYKMEGNFPEIMERDIVEDRELVLEHIEKRKSIYENISTEIIPLPKTWKWDLDKKTYILTEDRKITFKENKSNLKILFELLVKADGNWKQEKEITPKLLLMKNGKKPTVRSRIRISKFSFSDGHI